MQEINDEERLENAIKNQPDRYIVTRDKKGKLIEVCDKDSGRVHVKLKRGWGCVD